MLFFNRSKHIKKCLDNWRSIIGGSLLVFIILLAILAPYIAPYSPLDIKVTERLELPNHKNIFGTDYYGRDVFSRVIWGARVSLFVGILVSIIVGIFGTIIGLIAGYSDKASRLLMGTMDGFMAFPAIFLALALMSVFGAGTMQVIYAISIVYIPRCARVVRSCVLPLRSLSFVKAARSIGNPHWRIIFKHILPNIVSPLVIQMSVTFSNAILSEAGLSFLGVGQPPPMPSWGNILSEGRVVIWNAPWVSFFPGIAIFITVLALNVLGDGLRDKLDPKFRV